MFSVCLNYKVLNRFLGFNPLSPLCDGSGSTVCMRRAAQRIDEAEGPDFGQDLLDRQPATLEFSYLRAYAVALYYGILIGEILCETALVAMLLSSLLRWDWDFTLADFWNFAQLAFLLAVMTTGTTALIGTLYREVGRCRGN